MTTTALPTTPPGDSGEGPADRALRAYVDSFRHRNGRNPNSGTIHAVIARTDWLGTIPIAVTACGSGIGGTTGRLLIPTLHAVTCGLCLNLPAARQAAAHVPTGTQLSLV